MSTSRAKKTTASFRRCRRAGAASLVAILLSGSIAAAQGMVLTMQGDGSLSASTPQASFSRTYVDGIGQTAISDELAVLDRRKAAEGERSGDLRNATVAASTRAPAPAILAAIDETALRYASHPGPRRAGLSVTQWRRLYRSNIEIESAYDPRARSPKGAIGLGQLMPQTAAALGVDPHDWRQNPDGSARYLASLLDTFGDARLALAAYNAGLGAVERQGGIPPFRETRNHVRRVLAVFDRLEGDRS